MAFKGKTKSLKDEEAQKKGKNTGGSAGGHSGTGNQPVTQPVVPGVPRAGNRGQVAGATNSILSQSHGPAKLSAGKAPAPSLSSFAAAGYRAGSSLGRTSGAIDGVTAWRPPKPVMSYEQAAESAVRLYDEYTKKQTAFDERYGGLEHPEMYYGWEQRGDELTALRERYGKMLDHMNRHYMEMAVEPTFTFSGTAADVTPYQQQIDQMRGELDAYVSASNGLPDPNYVRQQQMSIARLQAALDTLPKEAQGEEALLQVLGGNYYDNVTVGGTAAQIGLGLAGLDLPMDLRDLSYDLTHLRTTPWQQTLLDALAILPVVGGLKYADEAAELAQAGRRVDDLAAGAEAVSDAARAGQRLVEMGTEGSKAAEAAIRIQPGAAVDDVFYLQPQAALDEDWYKQYNAARERFAEAAANSGTADTVTYYRVQGGIDGDKRSWTRIIVNEDGTISLDRKKANLNVSAYDMEHALHYQANNRVGADIVAFEVPRWFDDFVRQESIIQNHYRTNPLNQGRAAPKMTDLTTPGCTFELPPIWNEWLEEYAMNAKVISFGGG